MSETTNLRLFKNDNLETNNSEFDIKKSLNNNWDIIDDFVEVFPQGEKEGNSINIKDSSNIPMTLRINGKHNQATSVQNNNYLDTSLFKEETKSGVQLSKNSDGSITLNGTATEDVAFNTTLKNEFSKENYHLHIAKLSGTVEQGTVQYFLYTDDYSANKSVSISKTLNGMTAKLDNKTYSIEKITVPSGSVLNNVKINVWTSATGTKYEHFIPDSPTPKYPLKVDTFKSVQVTVKNSDNSKSQVKTIQSQEEMLDGDYIEDVEYHTWGKYIFTGNEDITLDDTYNGIAQFGFKLPNSYQNTTQVEICAYSNYFKGTVYQYNQNNTICGRYNANIYRIMTSEFTTVASFKTWLQEQYEAGIPLVVYYKLAEPKTLELTDTQREALKFNTYKTVTDISLNNELATVKVTYIKDLETWITNLISGNEGE
ncbi:MAG: hypothetical protein HFJ55_05130 [Clostridia bacterium]|nr:hypothetical protein [Clostridia bacterium]